MFFLFFSLFICFSSLSLLLYIKSPLHKAAFGGSVEITLILLQSGADPKIIGSSFSSFSSFTFFFCESEVVLRERFFSKSNKQQTKREIVFSSEQISLGAHPNKKQSSMVIQMLQKQFKFSFLFLPLFFFRKFSFLFSLFDSVFSLCCVV